MKFIGLAFVLFCAVAYGTAQVAQEEQMQQEYEQARFRREANPQGSLVITGQKPLSGPDRRPSLDINYQRPIFERQGVNGNAYGGVNISPGQPARPHVGMNFEKTYKNGGFGGFGHVERGPGGRLSPVLGVGGRFTF
ncbi:hymenoptaecin [Megachile rotundata]|uniref:hymenoptaecin n=1 Tax=Megachile rotundata TaxID=143995 RepID=UPI003FCEF310